MLTVTFKFESATPDGAGICTHLLLNCAIFRRSGKYPLIFIVGNNFFRIDILFLLVYGP